MSDLERKLFLTTTMSKWVIKESFTSIVQNAGKDTTKEYESIIESQLESKRRYKQKLEEL